MAKRLLLVQVEDSLTEDAEILRVYWGEFEPFLVREMLEQITAIDHRPRYAFGERNVAVGLSIISSQLLGDQLGTLKNILALAAVENDLIPNIGGLHQEAR